MKRFVVKLLTGFVLLGFLACSSRNDPESISIIPQPVSIEYFRGLFHSGDELPIYFLDSEKGLSIVANNLATIFKNSQIRTPVYELSRKKLSGKGIYLILDPGINNMEEYLIEVTRKRILIKGGSPQGVFYGVQSLRQILPAELEDPRLSENISSVTLPRLRIKDYPAFEYRGMHLDVARHFFPVSFIKKYIDLMALHKMNNFHWHLTEDQGWRIEIKKYPKLTEIGAWRDETLIGHGSREPFVYDGIPYGGYYTQDEIREVVAYAAERFVNIIPEIEMPGHATAALASYPELGCKGGPYKVISRWGIFDDVFCAGNELVFIFLEDVLSEVVELFPSKLIHIGGDECPKTRWKQCLKCQSRIKDEGLADEYELQSYFIRRIENFLLTEERNIIGWDEILEGGLAPQATVMSWRGVEGAIEAVRMGQPAVMSPVSHCYFDYYQADPETQPLSIGSLITLKKVYSYDPIPEGLTEEETKLILGAQGNVWTEYMKTSSHVEYMAYPRAIALAEVVWSPKNKRNYESFLQRLSKHSKRLDLLDVNYYRGDLP